VKRVITIVRIEADFDVVFTSSVALKDFSNPVAEIPLHFENEASDPLIVSCQVSVSDQCNEGGEEVR
jgi:hypothetical protein